SSIFWPGMETKITKFYHMCQTYKSAKFHCGKQRYGKLPPRTLKMVDPLDIVDIDPIGPWDDGGYGVTMIDHATRWLQIWIQKDWQALATAETFNREWLSCYPQPCEVVYDNGKEFIGEVFQELLQSYGINKKPITTKDPQVNAICKRVHIVLLNITRCYENVN
ncbi:Pol Polyprotein, partial [Phytophthora megakarya]